jgi:hypothetical protein
MPTTTKTAISTSNQSTGGWGGAGDSLTIRVKDAVCDGSPREDAVTVIGYDPGESNSDVSTVRATLPDPYSVV